MNRKNIATLFLIVCIVFINIEIKVQAEVIDGKIDWESATILTVYDEKIFFSIYDNITDKTVYFQYNVESDKCNKIGEIDNQEISSGDIAYNNDEIFFWVSKKKEKNIYNDILYSLDLKRSELKPITTIEVNQPLIYVEYLDGVISYIGKIYGKYGKGILSSASILIGMVVGYLICIPLGLVDFSAVKDASFVSIPKIFEYGVTFDLKALIAFLPAYFVTTIETVGCLKAIGEVSNVDMNDKRVGSGVLADGVGSIFGGVVGAFPNTSFSQNVGLIPLTKVASKHVAVMAGILLVVLGLFPKFAALINGIPQPVLGGVGIVMFGTVAAAGIKTLSKVEINDRNLLIIATSIGLGLGVTFRPDFISNLPEGLQMVFSSGISTGTIVALVLNIVLKDDKNNEIENIKDLECEGA